MWEAAALGVLAGAGLGVLWGRLRTGRAGGDARVRVEETVPASSTRAAAEPQDPLVSHLRLAHHEAMASAFLQIARARASRRQLFTRVGHELRTPLSSILALAELAVGETSRARQQEQLAHLIEAAARLRHRVDRLLDLAELDDPTEEHPVFSLDQLEEDLRAGLGALAPGALLRVERGPELPASLTGDHAALRLLLLEAMRLLGPREDGSFELVFQKDVPEPPAFMTVTVRGGHPVGADDRRARGRVRHLVEYMGARWEEGAGESDGRGPTAGRLCFRVPLRGGEDLDEITLVDPVLLVGQPLLLLAPDDEPWGVITNELRAWGMEPRTCRDPGELRRRLEEDGAMGLPAPLVLACASRWGERPADGAPGPPALRLVLVLPPGAPEEEHARWLCRGARATLRGPPRPGEVLEALIRLAATPEPGRAPSHPAPGSRSRVRVLLADDHAVNRELFSTLLRNEGALVTPVSDGIEAVEHALGETPFDLILMDLRMPNLDGEQAIRRIRKEEARRGRPPVPIVALTAQLLDGDRERLRRLGADAGLCKPVRRAELVELVRALTGLSPRSSPPEVPMPQRDPSPAIERELLHDLTGGDAELMLELLRLMREELPMHRARLQRAAAAGGLEELARAVHALRGAAGNLGARALREACATVEEAARSQLGETARGHLPALFCELDRLEMELIRAAPD